MKSLLLNYRKWLFLAGMIMSVTSNSYAKNIGMIAQVYPITEVDFIEFIQERASHMEQDGSLNSLQGTMQTRANQYRDRPKSVGGIKKVTQVKTWLFDPGIVLDHDIISPDGKIIAFRGTYVNPLIYVSLSRTLIFYDADDKAQHEWAIALDKKLKGRDKVILVNGSLLNEEKYFSKAIFFDQEGRLTQRFGISHVPATVDQEGKSLRIHEVIP